MNEKEKLSFAEQEPQINRKLPQVVPAKDEVQIILHESEYTDFEYIEESTNTRPHVVVPFEINIPVPSLKTTVAVVKYISMVGIAGGTAYLIWVGVLFLVAWVYTPLILIGIAVFIFLFICVGSLTGRSLQSQDNYPSRRTGTGTRNINITNIVNGDGDTNITNIIN